MTKRMNCHILHVRKKRAVDPGIIERLNFSFRAKLNSSGLIAIVFPWFVIGII